MNAVSYIGLGATALLVLWILCAAAWVLLRRVP